MLIEKNLKFILIICFSLFSFIGVSATKTNDVLNKTNVKQNFKEDSLKKLKYKETVDVLENKEDLKSLETEKEDKIDYVVDEKELKEVYEDFCEKNKIFDRYYGLESMALRDINENYSNYIITINAKNLAEDDLFNSNNKFNISSTYDRLDGLYRKRDYAFIAYPYNKIEKYESFVLDSLDDLKTSFKKLKKIIKTKENEELIKKFFNETLPKSSETLNEINDKYRKYLKLSENKDENRKEVNSNTLFMYYDKNRESNNCDLEKTVNFLLFYVTKIFVNLKFMDLEEKTIKTINKEFWKLLKYYKEEEIKSLGTNCVLEKLQKQVDFRDMAFKFIFKIGKIAEFYAEKQIASLHHKKGSLVFRVKSAMSNPKNSFGCYIQKVVDKNLNYLK